MSMTAEIKTRTEPAASGNQEREMLQALTAWADSAGGIRVEEIDLAQLGTFFELGYTSGWRVLVPTLGLTDAERLHAIAGDKATIIISADASTIDKYTLPMVRISIYTWV